MEERQKNNKFLVYLFCFCLVIVAGLTTGIILVNANKTGEIDEVVVEDESSEEIETVWTDPEAAEATKIFSEQLDSIELEATELLSQGPANMDKIHDLYAGPYSEFVSNGEISYAYAYLLSESGLYYENGYEYAALDLLVSTDLTIYDDTLQWIFYDTIIGMADKLGKPEISSDYRTRAAYLEENADLILAPDSIRYSEEIKDKS